MTQYWVKVRVDLGMIRGSWLICNVTESKIRDYYFLATNTFSKLCNHSETLNILVPSWWLFTLISRKTFWSAPNVKSRQQLSCWYRPRGALHCVCFPLNSWYSVETWALEQCLTPSTENCLLLGECLKSVSVCAHICRDQSTTSAVVPQGSSPSFLEIGPLIVLELTNLSHRPTCFVVPVLRLQEHACFVCLFVLTWVLRNWPQVLGLTR